MTAAKYTITENDKTVASWDVTLACASGYSSTGTPTAACTSAGDYTVTNPCTGASPAAGLATGAEAILTPARYPPCLFCNEPSARLPFLRLP